MNDQCALHTVQGMSACGAKRGNGRQCLVVMAAVEVVRQHHLRLLVFELAVGVEAVVVHVG